MRKTLLFILAALFMSFGSIYADNITNLTQVVEGTKYTLTCNRGSLTVSADLTSLKSTKDAGTTLDPTDAKFQFQFVADGENYYLYNVAAAKYSTNSGSLVESIADAAPIYLQDCGDGTARPYFDADHNINFGGSQQLVIDDWSDADGGNKFTISPIELTTYTIVVSGLEGQGGVVINGQQYTNGQQVDTFASAVASATAIDVTGYYSSISVEGTTITVTYTVKAAFAVNFNALTVYDADSNIAKERHMYRFALGEEEHELAEELRTYSDQTSITYTVQPGATVKPALTIGTSDNKAWLHGYLYVNTTDDNQFTTDELVSSTPISTNSAVNMSEFAEFVAPATIGTYRMRVKLDWDNNDPNGNDVTIGTVSPNIIYGSVVDLTLVVTDATGVRVSVNENVNENRYDLQGRLLLQPQRGFYIQGGRKIVR